MTKPLISAALIVRDEEAMLGDCLASLQGFVDEIVVVDTGSVDGTEAIARRHGARVFHRVWTDDFSAARNASLDEVTGEWVLYIDADERLVVADRDAAEHLLRTAPEVAFRIDFRPHQSMTAYVEYRLWRNDPRIRFEGSLHERIVPAIHHVADTEGRPVSDCHLLRLEHVGYEGDQTAKHLRNLPLLEKFVKEEPGHVFARHHLAVVLDELGRHDEAEARLWEALECIRGDPEDPVGDTIYVSLVTRLQESDRDHRALLQEGLTHYPENCWLLWLNGRDLMADGQLEEAVARFEGILAIAAEPPRYEKPAYELSLVGEDTYSALATCLFRLGRYAEAAEAYGRAAQCAPDNETYAWRRQLALGRAGQGS
jgi:glycosyltransferase involved in cell wall biosynthesis